MELMGRYDIDELSFAGITIKKSRHKMVAIVPPADDRATMAQHLAPLPNEPWNDIPQEQVDDWAEKGRP
jgi:hypothetical protein